MARDGVANIVHQLRERGYTPRKVGQDAWESRCPGHRSSDYALSITRNEFNHVVLKCRNAENCQHIRFIRALGFTNEHLYAEKPEWLIRRLGGVPIHTPEVKIPEALESPRRANSARKLRAETLRTILQMASYSFSLSPWTPTLSGRIIRSMISAACH